MTILKMYEKINLKAPVEQRIFLNHYDDSVNELISMYGDNFVLIDDAEYETPTTDIYGDSVVLPLYHNAIIDNILFMVSNEANYKSEFVRKSKDAYLNIWNDRAKGRRQRRMRW